MLRSASTSALLSLLALGAACTPVTEPAASPAGASAPAAASNAPAAAPEPVPSASSAAPTPAPAPAAPSASTPPPLSGSTGGPLPFASRDAGAPAAGCHPGVVKTKLQAIVDTCRKTAASVCGTVTVHAGHDGKSVNVSVNVNSTSGADPFTHCVTRHVNAVAWECAKPGSDITVDLGCTL